MESHLTPHQAQAEHVWGHLLGSIKESLAPCLSTHPCQLHLLKVVVRLQWVKQLLDRGNRVIAGVRTPGKAPKLRQLQESHTDALSIVELDVLDTASIENGVGRLPANTSKWTCAPPCLSLQALQH
jgi:hypothetical protein